MAACPINCNTTTRLRLALGSFTTHTPSVRTFTEDTRMFYTVVLLCLSSAEAAHVSVLVPGRPEAGQPQLRAQ